jgi:hypothetical protein
MEHILRAWLLHFHQECQMGGGGGGVTFLLSCFFLITACRLNLYYMGSTTDLHQPPSGLPFYLCKLHSLEGGGYGFNAYLYVSHTLKGQGHDIRMGLE